MANKLNPKAVAFALAKVSGIIYIVCAILIAIAPEAALSLFGSMFHGINIELIAQKSISPSSTIIGFIEIVIGSLITGWLFAWFYNKIA